MREQLTRKDVEKIEQEIEHRKLVVRKEAIEAVKEARAQGDLSENFEYYAAKKHKNQNESRIRYLERHPLYPMLPDLTKWEWTISWKFFLKKIMRWRSTSWLLPSAEIPWKTVSVLNRLSARHCAVIV